MPPLFRGNAFGFRPLRRMDTDVWGQNMHSFHSRLSSAALLTALLMTGSAQAQQGSQGASGMVGASYAGSSQKGAADLQAIAALPTDGLTPFPVKLKATAARHFSKRIAIPTYSFMLVRSGHSTAYAGGAGSMMMGRRTTIDTALVGISDEMAQTWAQDAYDDLVAQLARAGFEVIPAAEVAANPDIQKVAAVPSPALTAPPQTTQKQPVYGPAAAPLRQDAWFLSLRPNAYGDASKSLDAVILLPGLSVDYERIASSGTKNWSANASVDANLRFHAVENSGASFALQPPAPYRGTWIGMFVMPEGSGTDAPFGVMDQTGDKSDNVALHTALALSGLGNTFKQKKVYAVTVDPGRYGALVRCAYQGFNAALVAEIVKAAQ